MSHFVFLASWLPSLAIHSALETTKANQLALDSIPSPLSLISASNPPASLCRRTAPILHTQEVQIMQGCTVRMKERVNIHLCGGVGHVGED
jgi:hypothetical protein